MSPSSLLALPLAFLALLSVPLSAAASSELDDAHALGGGLEHGLGLWRRFVAEMPTAGNVTVGNATFVLAAERTYRKDPLNGYQRYSGGWNISDQHYWASVGFTATPLFAIAVAWFLGFGFVLFIICCCYCCCRRRKYSYSRVAYALSLILLVLFTIAAILGCVVLYNGQGKFHTSTSETLDYVVSQANLTVDNLKNFSSSLAAAKNIGVDKVFLPAEDQKKIVVLQQKLVTAATVLSTRTSENSRKIQGVLNSVGLGLVIVAAVMLALAFLGFIFSMFGLQFLVSLLVLVGWILVAGTFALCGVFLLLHNVVGDACVAMNEWVAHPQAHTALDDILPCVDVATANESMYRSKEVTLQLVKVVNEVIVNISNRNFPAALAPLYFNQSGPLVPLLCSPYLLDMSNRTCIAEEVRFSDASQVWKGYVCQTTVVNGNEICTTVGRITPAIYTQMSAAVNVTQGLYYYGPFLTQLADCTFVRETFTALSKNNCPGLDLYSEWIYIGLEMVSAAVMLSLIFWLIYARERRHRKQNKQLLSQSSQPYDAYRYSDQKTQSGASVRLGEAALRFCSRYKTPSESEKFHNSFDEALVLKRKAEEVLPFLNERCIYLVGMMGSGKSTVGKILSEVLDYSFFDSDKLVEQDVGVSSVAQIFKDYSEAFFRDNESQVLKDLSTKRRLVIATGGGAVIRPINWKYMKQGITVWPDVPLEALARRIAGIGTASRPLLHQEPGDPYTKALAKLTALSEERGMTYATADVRVSLEHIAGKKGCGDVAALTPSDIAFEALIKIENYVTENAAVLNRRYIQG